jgi:hypothetical protein
MTQEYDAIMAIAWVFSVQIRRARRAAASAKVPVHHVALRAARIGPS